MFSLRRCPPSVQHRTVMDFLVGKPCVHNGVERDVDRTVAMVVAPDFNKVFVHVVHRIGNGVLGGDECFHEPKAQKPKQIFNTFVGIVIGIC